MITPRGAPIRSPLGREPGPGRPHEVGGLVERLDVKRVLVRWTAAVLRIPEREERDRRRGVRRWGDGGRRRSAGGRWRWSAGGRWRWSAGGAPPLAAAERRQRERAGDQAECHSRRHRADSILIGFRGGVVPVTIARAAARWTSVHATGSPRAGTTMPASASTSTRSPGPQALEGAGHPDDCRQAALARLGGDVVEGPPRLGDQGGHLQQGQLGRQEGGGHQHRVRRRGRTGGVMPVHAPQRPSSGPRAAQNRTRGEARARAHRERRRILKAASNAVRPWATSPRSSGPPTSASAADAPGDARVRACSSGR